jgi:hypothetical protein
MGEVSWKGQIPLPGHGNTPWQIEQMPHGKALAATAAAEFTWRASLQLRTMVAVCPDSELICPASADEVLLDWARPLELLHQAVVPMQPSFASVTPTMSSP